MENGRFGRRAPARRGRRGAGKKRFHVGLALEKPRARGRAGGGPRKPLKNPGKKHEKKKSMQALSEICLNIQVVTRRQPGAPQNGFHVGETPRERLTKSAGKIF